MTAFAPPQGKRPNLEWLQPTELSIDPIYQRSVETAASKKLIRTIAQRWRWDLCLPLLVSRRPDGSYFVVDGQHRLMAAVLRGDIAILPCFIRQLDGAAAEASLFITANRARKAMSALDDYHAAVAAGDEEASAIDALVRAADLSIAHHSAAAALKPGELVSVAGLKTAISTYGAEIVGRALKLVGEAFPDEVLVNSAALVGGIVRLLTREDGPADEALFDTLLDQTTQGWAYLANLADKRGGAQREKAIAAALLDAVGRRRQLQPARATA